NHLTQTEALEAISQGGASCFGGKASAPGPAGEPPANLGGGHEGVHGEADVTDQLGFVRDLDRPQSETPIAPVRLDTVDESVRLLAGHRPGEWARYLGIRVQCGKRLAIRRPPLPEHEALGANHSLEP